ncbi:LLM class flavin-dependent oxidoreductase [Parvibaculum sp.]|uniref:LLM class flavin-dependent oxidoreductase n=1 Tax=Parvibaculum sp. TaxID=2024848 RepID=UPI000C4DD8A4|nr:LLM class flavin-dependent oxidoreductase [Parvibaculum sp.]HAC57839.1 LLM class flavin-dependent oxidoreductase [Rhodobiaceae bacterium]MAU60836.1 LLM class flavin-dependent oxidoreductase [Parvibaculum sp.]MBO6668766.1 LLM class flavin-dependent oxidoreductase [Parvibaculum sp.]MBO6691495.1 LLM class flavin-dependent oxidoreductase [Parvibaculum sp.]MBO6714443.1 LLM class flavin-dependent oxidoreductase [Parvibaculum sp.]|tara:strand:- start:19824 stop:21041 length:1218 start_codon:yes stop_codon:yes gene_type:complete
MPGQKMRFGAFIAPFHPLNENPTLALERDIELVQWMDKLGYDEAWIGEHHSAGYELIASPELFIATVAERTRNIKLGTGVSSLPYHHPLMLADRINQLDHITRGRVMLGVGPGSLPSDAFMMGITVAKQRDMMDEALDVIVPLLRGEKVTAKTDWFELKDAQLQMTPWSRPSVEIAVASQVSPTGATAAGRHGLGLLSIGATSAGGFNALSSNWAICEDTAKDNGKTVDRSQWRLVGPVHIAETREKARENVRFGLEQWLYYFREVAALPLAPTDGSDPVDALIASGMAVIGTPDDAIAQIERLQAQSGGFGCFMQLAHNWADWENTKRSYELMARYVFPKFQNLNDNREASLNWARDNRPTFMGEAMMAVGSRVAQHVEKKGTENIRPEILAAMGLDKKNDAAE